MEITQDIVDRIDEVLNRGLCVGVGSRDGQMCVEAAICYALGEPHGDNPSCVEPAVRRYKIALNDFLGWGSPSDRAAGMRALAIAQLGSLGVVDGPRFASRLAELTIRQLIPRLFREVCEDVECLAAADRCELEGTSDAAYAAYLAAVSAANAAVVDTVIYAANAAAAAAVATHAANAAAVDAAYAAADAAANATADADDAAASAASAADAAADAAAAADTRNAARNAAYAADAAADAARNGARYAADAADAAAAHAATHAAHAAGASGYLVLSASLALQVLRELGSPGCEWLPKEGP